MKIMISLQYQYVKIYFTILIHFRQEAFMENYFASQRDNIFRNVEVLIYVFDVESRELEKDMHYYQSCLEAILQNSPDAKVFCLVHKMDLVQDDQRDMVRQKINLLNFSSPKKMMEQTCILFQFYCEICNGQLIFVFELKFKKLTYFPFKYCNKIH